MTTKKIFLFLSAVALCLLIGIACSEDWLGGGYVGSYREI
jgi:hypothetical protein